MATAVDPRDGPVSLIKDLVLPDKQASQSEGEEAVEEHESGAHPHSHAVVRAVLTRVESGAQEGPALANEVQDCNTGAALGIGALVVENPGKDVTNAGEDTCSCEKDSSVSGSGCGGGSENNITSGADERKSYDHETTLLCTIGNVCCGDGEKEGEEVGGCGKTLGLDIREGHLGENRREEDGQG